MTTSAADMETPVTGTGTYTWTLTLYENLGKVNASWNTTAPFRAQQGKIVLYQNGFPSEPTLGVWWSWDDINQPNPVSTGQTWGSGWCAAWIAQSSPNGPYVYVAQTSLTEES